MRITLSRIVTVIPTLILATVLVFSLMRLAPGDPAVAIAGEYASEERLAQIRQSLGLDQPLPVQYLSWVGGVLTGDLGDSILSGVPVLGLIAERLPATLHLLVGAMIFALGVGLPAGVFAARRAGRRADIAVSGASTLGVAMPNFWLGMLLVTVFALTLGWLPAIGYASIGTDPLASVRTLLLPSIALGAVAAAEMTRQVRSAMLGVLRSDAIRTHWAKGLSGPAVVWMHALKNAGVPIVTVVGLMLNHLLGATVVIETVFGIPGMGSLIVDAVSQRDYPVIQGVVLVMAVFVLAVNLVVDLVYRKLDPRIRL